MSAQLWAVLAVGAVVFAAVCLEAIRSQVARRRAIGATAAPASEPYILYFTGESCTVCRTHQEPALAKLGPVRVDRVDAVEDRAVADQFHVYTLPTTVVMSAEG
ncbi:MAG: thioredoxin family protein, partial [Candidatus Dormiibacterota bacterium]